MDKNGYLKLIMLFSVFGILFSGYLSYVEIFLGGTACGAGVPGAISQIFGIPVCVYGLFMYIVIGVLAYFAYASKK